MKMGKRAISSAEINKRGIKNILCFCQKTEIIKSPKKKNQTAACEINL